MVVLKNGTDNDRNYGHRNITGIKLYAYRQGLSSHKRNMEKTKRICGRCIS